MSSSNEPSSDKGQEEKTSDSKPVDVHSANAWETADLGDDERRKKFLRLMGASKKEHHGRFIIGEKEQTGTHGREKEKTEKLNKDLEKQFIHSQEHKITKKSHTGLGFQADHADRGPGDIVAAAKSEKNTQSETDKKDSKQEAASDNKEQQERKRESSEANQGDQSPPKKPKMMMAFVKASD